MVRANEDLVPLVNCGSNIEASTIRSVLEDNDIFCFVQGEQHRSMLGVLGSFVELRVLVRQDELEQARALLAEYEASAQADLAAMPDDDDEDDEDDEKRD